MYRVDEAACTGCGDCVEVCPAEAIALVEGRARLDQALCADCGSCAAACPQGAITAAAVIAPAHAVRRPSTSLLPIVPSPAAVETSGPIYRPDVELAPAEPGRSRLWPAVGGALVWAARELLPAVLQAWQETPGRAGGTMTTVRRLAGRGGEAGGRRRNRWRRSGQGGGRGQSGSGSPNRNRC